jgi:MFS family permease
MTTPSYHIGHITNTTHTNARSRYFRALLAASSPTRTTSCAQRGGLVSDTGDWLLLIALPIYVFTLTGSALNTSTVFLAELIPALLFGSFAGVLVDRWNRRRTMLVTNLLQAGLLVPLLAVARDRLWVLYVVAAIQACLASLFVPAKHALLTRLVDGQQLMAANALIGVNDNMARLVGAPLGGLAIVAVGLPGVVALDAGSFLISAALLAACRPAPIEMAGNPTTPRSFFRDWLHGLGVVARIRSLRVVLAITALGQLAQGMFVVLFVVFVLRTLVEAERKSGCYEASKPSAALPVASSLGRSPGASAALRSSPTATSHSEPSRFSSGTPPSSPPRSAFTSVSSSPLGSQDSPYSPASPPPCSSARRATPWAGPSVRSRPPPRAPRLRPAEPWKLIASISEVGEGQR